MKKYFLHNGSESSGPFDLEELKAKRISKTTPIWFEGMENWKTASEIEELKSLFVVIPPPISSFSGTTSTLKKEVKTEKRKILGLSKTLFFGIIGGLIVLVVTIILNTLEEKRSQELKLKNHKTELENYQFELKQKEIEEQKIQEVIQEKIDADRMALEKKQNTNNRLLEIKNSLINYQKNLEANEKKLNDASDFKFLRTATEKKEQLNLLQKNIDSIKNEMNQLKNESEQLKLELEKIH
ncbi:MAG: GYF domain-containing protein [Flavobacterium sp.]|uniref:GYF domain-containing protein n=1 Tax=Flavobacterium sp. TaxID=239 RepID=UPI002613ACDE|nr:GYF domain-containing protein [Flavobacterium sp.]MDD5150412.1 GYF domain-containing protein [Flavobacterium sp.]